jgi:uncharacterized protein YkwD
VLRLITDNHRSETCRPAAHEGITAADPRIGFLEEPRVPILVNRRLIALSVLAALVLGPTLRAQVLLPPDIIKKRAEREEKNSHSAPTTRPANAAADARPVHGDQAAHIDSLRATALGFDPAASATALRELRGMGQPARPALHDVVRQLLAHDRSVIEAAHGLPSSARLHELSEKISAERQAARTNIDKLAHDETIKIAHDHYTSLKALRNELDGAFDQTDAILGALSRRASLRTLWREVAAPGESAFGDEEEAKLDAKAQKMVSMTAEQAASIPELGQGEQPAEPVLRDLWFYRACRRIDSFNIALKACMTQGEFENFSAVNAYRRCLGILPYELDSRLVASARAHSKEMVDLKYFAHESPVSANKTPWDRIRTAGYPQGSGENIAAGPTDAEQVFGMWFDSPGHHQNMARPGNTAMGVGQVGNHWTQNMGSAPRLLLASPEERKAAIAAANSGAPKGMN